jgi:hypothetical protein
MGGIIGNVVDQAVIQNCSVYGDMYFNFDSSSSTDYHSGSAGGIAESLRDSHINNCQFNGSIGGSGYGGSTYYNSSSSSGIVQSISVNSTVTSVAVQGSISGHAGSNGGLIGSLNASDLSQGRASVTIDQYDGSSAGVAVTATNSDLSCVSVHGAVTSSSDSSSSGSSQSAGAVMNLTGSTLEDSYSNVLVEDSTSSSSSSGHSVSGFVLTANNSTISRVFAKGSVTSSDDSSTTSSSFGALVFTMSNGSVLEDCYSELTLSHNFSSSSYSVDIGGLVTSLNASTIQRCYSTSDVEYYDDGSYSGNYGGLVASDTATSAILNSFSVGDVTDTGSGGGGGGSSVNAGAFIGSTSGTLTNNYWHNSTSSFCDPTQNYTGCSAASGYSQFYTSTNNPLASWDFSVSGPWDDVNNGTDYPVLKDECSRQVSDAAIPYGTTVYTGGGNFTITEASSSNVLFDMSDYNSIKLAATALQQKIDQNVVVWSHFEPGTTGTVHFYIQNLDGSVADVSTLTINGLFLDDAADTDFAWTGSGAGNISDLSTTVEEFDMLN